MSNPLVEITSDMYPFCSLDVQATAALDADVEAQRQNLFVKALGFLASKLRATREISTEQEKKVWLQQNAGELSP